ncbi:hypothetical protein AAZX31_09G102800 [Glycine max]|uniref:Uncharacterized protein n=2 Tax=Glycine subgen. Soja TaxID=1462606 RepID=K7LD71_SOYBN|nr:uncharacterized protein LOC100779304 [Glycine max]XP_028180471.1 uncharacterized protein LOC114367481 [Glycine soja]KAG4991225.1 hypothetical protein JHK87_024682 [Glycine soja]KAG5012581.1 hypothetical protein JHK86_024842 [Glycine max]KAG5133539.1 hypothetical protein JHK82_024727 [Glycine max]KAH1042511.1 hypothetical protein GYH30_024694 [Glycine max]KAH1233076.1 hypothetical protein GmHk_09G025598 [Glycine max]|eukprot:XP_003533918.1 uncharacterized protein LOC100779304 [Glycine max]
MDIATTGVQHVTKKSSDELLRKFAEVGDSNNAPKKKKTKRTAEDGSGTAVVERRSLLLRAHLRARDLTHFRTKSLLGTIEKTWRRTIEGASRAFIERHYHRHKRLINDIV